jgi:hypothetical protein
MKQKVRKRANSAITIIAYEKEDIEPFVKELMKIIEATYWDYKSEFRDLFRKRDEALVSLLLLSDLRISEVLDPKFFQVFVVPLEKKAFSLHQQIAKCALYDFQVI